SVALGNGPWAPAQNLTQTPQTDERFPAIAPRNSGGKVGVLFQASATNQAGIAESQDRGTTPSLYVRRIARLERHLRPSAVSADEPLPGAVAPPTLAASPNPARGAVSFAAGGNVKASAVLVFTVDGRRMARLTLDGGRATWDGRDLGGRPVPSGVYLARI